MASHNPALWHGLDHLGAMAPGYQADLLLLRDLEAFQPDVVLKAGRPVAEIPPAHVPEWVKNTVRISPVGMNDLRIPWEGGRARVIGLVPEQIVTRSLVEEPPRRTASPRADPTPTWRRSPSSSATSGRAASASASCAGSGCAGERSPPRSLTTRTTSSSWASTTATWRGPCSGSQSWAAAVVAADRGVQAELPLPVAGLLSDAPLSDVVAASRACNEAAAPLGCTVATPFQAFAFLALSVIPS